MHCVYAISLRTAHGGFEGFGRRRGPGVRYFALEPERGDRTWRTTLLESPTLRDVDREPAGIAGRPSNRRTKASAWASAKPSAVGSTPVRYSHSGAWLKSRPVPTT